MVIWKSSEVRRSGSPEVLGAPRLFDVVRLNARLQKGWGQLIHAYHNEMAPPF
jgi:hypothetical protein